MRKILFIVLALALITGLAYARMSLPFIGTVQVVSEEPGGEISMEATPVLAAAAGATSTNIDVTSLSIADGDFILLFVAISNTSAVTPEVSGGEWTAVDDYQIYNGYENAGWCYVFRKFASSEETTWTISHSYGYSGVIAWKTTGVNTTNPIDASPVHQYQSGETSSTVTSASITTTVDGVALIQFFGNDNGLAASTGSTLTVRYDSATGQRAAMFGDLQASAGASGEKTVTMASSRRWTSIMVPLRPE